QDKIREKTGYLLPLREDKDTAEKEYEIHIGNTIRTAKPQSGYDYDSWEIAIADKKVYIAGGSTYSVQVALTEFGKMLDKGTLTNANSKTGSYAATVAGYDSATYYKLTWQEEFDYEAMSIEESGWTIDPITVNNNMKTDEDGNSYRRYGTSFMVTDADTSIVTNGNFIMRGIKMEDATIHYPADQAHGGGTSNPELLYKHQAGYHSGSVMMFNFGYIEMRAKLPDGPGVYSSFWFNKPDRSGRGGIEVDIFESLGMAHTLRANIHYWGSSFEDGHTSLDSGLYGKGVDPVDGKDRQYVLPKEEGTLFDDYHTIGCYWSWDGIRFYCDGVMYYEGVVDEFHYDQYCEIIGGFNIGWAGRIAPADDLKFPLEYHVDYFRLYQVDGQGLKLFK
ncbi:MAG: family 16 glycosylhydrolase, partial [Clostridia bacterium]|nr:family 16 glycosylhydrolase [Clostridia bacterium]